MVRLKVFKKYFFIFSIFLLVFLFILRKNEENKFLNPLKYITPISNNAVDSTDHFLNDDKRQKIFNHLLLLNSFLIDINVLETIINRVDYKKKFQITSNYLVYGIFDSNINLLEKEKINIENFGCEITEAFGLLIDTAVPTVYFIKCSTIQIQLSVFYKRGQYFWIGDDESKHSDPKWFSDIPRGINNFDDDKVKVPLNIEQFLFDYKHSKFIECNRMYAKESVKRMGNTYAAQKTQNLKAQHGLVYVKSVLEGLQKNYWLAAGTLLGWYRDCGYIPHTTDGDLAMWEHDYDDSVFNKFKGNKNAMLVQTLGLRREAFELRLFTSHFFTIDIFLMYNVNATFQWNGNHINIKRIEEVKILFLYLLKGYQGHRKLYRQLVLKFDDSNLCSGELLENIFMVPCNPEEYLSFQYGEDKWRIPMKNHYFNYDSIGFYKFWPDDEWPYVVRWYDLKTGIFNEEKTLMAINKYMEKPITKLPEGFL